MKKLRQLRDTDKQRLGLHLLSCHPTHRLILSEYQSQSIFVLILSFYFNSVLVS